MNLECHVCGKKFRSMLAEAKHRHNFPAMCRRNERFRIWEKDIQISRLKEALELAVIRWFPSEPGDSRAVSDEFVAVAAVASGLGDSRSDSVIRAAIERHKAAVDAEGTKALD